MKIGIYTDIHCAITSSILPLHTPNSEYTTRLQMIVSTFKWMYSLFEQQNVDLIVNCGDLFDSYNVRAEEISAMGDALSFGGKIPEIHILGNHEILDKQRKFNAVALLDNYSHISVISDPMRLSNKLSFLPYCDADTASEVVPYLSNDILFSHIDIRGSYVTPQHALDTGVSPSRLQDNFKRVINGHLHSPQTFGECVHNIGASTSLSFSDNSDYIPRVSILDTRSLKLEYFDNPFAIRFCKLDNATSDSVMKLIESSDNQLCVRVKCKVDEVPSITGLLKKNIDAEKVVAYRIISIGDNSTHIEIPEVPAIIESVYDVEGKFREFLSSRDDLKYSLSEYIDVLNDIKKEFK